MTLLTPLITNIPERGVQVYTAPWSVLSSTRGAYTAVYPLDPAYPPAADGTGGLVDDAAWHRLLDAGDAVWEQYATREEKALRAVHAGVAARIRARGVSPAYAAVMAQIAQERADNAREYREYTEAHDATPVLA